MQTPRSQYRRPPRLAFNATPMVDVFFMLAIFYMLVTRFSSAEQVPMELPRPEGSLAEVAHLPERVVINCRLADPARSSPSTALYSVGPNRPESLAMISERLAALKRQSPGLKVIIRADRRLDYAPVRALMRVIAHHRIDMLNVVAHVADDE